MRKMAVFAVAASTALGVFETEISEQRKGIRISLDQSLPGFYTLICARLDIDLVVARAIMRDEFD